MNAANDNARACTPRDAARDIAALLRSGHVEAGGALPISQRVQTSGRGDPQLPRWSAESERAQRILGRAWSEGGEARRCALALWLVHGYGEHGVGVLELGCVFALTEAERLQRAREWPSWECKGTRGPLAEGVELLERAAGWYKSASEDAGGAGHLGELTAAADALKGAWRRMKSEHERACAERKKAAKGLAV